MQPNHDDIARLAYQFYLEDGSPEGNSEEYWFRAEAFLTHPNDHSDQNVLAVPSEPELTAALDEKGRDLDTDSPSDPRTGKEAVHQKVELAMDRTGGKQDLSGLKRALKHLTGIERIEPTANHERVTVHFDARRTNPAAIHEAVSSQR